MSQKSDKESDERITKQITSELSRTISEAASDKRITCASLRRIAENMGVHYRVAGAAADAAGVKVRSCELGCF